MGSCLFASAVSLTALGAAASEQPVVVELFTAQGCSECPAANQSVVRLAEDPQVVVLTYGVDYWDYLGWADTFARPEFTQRQRGYLRASGQRNMVTPQVVIAGRSSIDRAQVDSLGKAIEEQGERPGDPPEIEFRETGTHVGVGSGPVPRGGAEVIAVRYSPGIQTVQVRSGDNRGKSVTHVNVVREIQNLGDWNGRSSLYALPEEIRPARHNGDAVLVLLQSKSDRRILSAARTSELRHD